MRRLDRPGNGTEPPDESRAQYYAPAPTANRVHPASFEHSTFEIRRRQSASHLHEWTLSFRRHRTGPSDTPSVPRRWRIVEDRPALAVLRDTMDARLLHANRPL